jgi:exodeoxyribonuclease VII small subunit
MSFEASVERLEEIVRALEEEELPLERALELFEEGVARLREATTELTRVEASVKVLRERADGLLETTDLDA